MDIRHLVAQVLASALLVIPGLASSAGSVHDWKYFGSSSAAVTGEEWFYLPAEITHLPNATVRVWTESLSSHKMLEFASHQPQDGPFATELHAKVASGYVPPFAALMHLDQDKSGGIILAETVADSGEVTADGTGLFTLDCKHKKYRLEQATEFDTNGSVTGQEAVGKWQIVVPDTVVDSLYTMVCR